MTKLSNPRKHGTSDVVRAARLSVAPMMDGAEGLWEALFYWPKRCQTKLVAPDVASLTPTVALVWRRC